MGKSGQLLSSHAARQRTGVSGGNGLLVQRVRKIPLRILEALIFERRIGIALVLTLTGPPTLIIELATIVVS